MEKYSKFTEDKSGVNPFTFQPYKPGPVAILYGAVLTLCKVPLLALAGLFMLLNVLLTSIIPLSVIQRPIRLILERLAARFTLYFLGYFRIEETQLSKAQIRLPASKSNASNTIKSGDIIVSNRCSYVDVLHFAAAYAPTFTITSRLGGLQEVSLWGALQHSVGYANNSLNGVDNYDDTTKQVIHRALKGYRGPLVVFPEGANSNNRAILSFTPVMQQISKAVVDIARNNTLKLRVPIVHLVGLKYMGKFSASYTAGGALLHAFFLSTQCSNTLHVYRAPEGTQPQPADFLASQTTNSDSAATGAWEQAERDALSQLVRGSRMVDLGVAQYAEFLTLFAANTAKKQQ